MTERTFSWSGHVCRNCLAVLGRFDVEGAAPVFECGTCTTSAKGSPDGICGCGVLPPASTGAATRRPGAAPPAPRFRCTPNPARSVTEPASHVIRWA